MIYILAQIIVCWVKLIISLKKLYIFCPNIESKRTTNKKVDKNKNKISIIL